ncbi:hypothetical protein [Shewanella sp. YLB-07]|uniref:hypothetical protein n=1 Tax=Shewanella sp. YLB-07 TaxID=2601268 RepID=UPI00128D60C4|nr:hypothetical protein [Shewanella sp. YLB-07]MPY24345.1 hypothetical protein [Shewanella sp. YLB-07]
MMRHYVVPTKVIGLCSLLIISSQAMAQVDCKGKITRLGLSLNNGILTVGLQGGPNAAQLCSIQLGYSYNNIDNDVCKTLYSTLLATKASDKQTTIRFYDHTSCTTPELSWKIAGALGWTAHLED